MGVRIQVILNNIRRLAVQEAGEAAISRWGYTRFSWPWRTLDEDNVVGRQTITAYTTLRSALTDRGRNDGNILPLSMPELSQNTRNLTAVTQKLVQLQGLLASSRPARRKLVYLLTPGT